MCLLFQASPEVQLRVALYRLGIFGNSASIGKIARHFGISEGTVVLYTDLVVTAFLSLEEKFVFLPNAPEKKQIKNRIREYSGFPNCLGFVDGTLLVLENKTDAQRRGLLELQKEVRHFGFNSLRRRKAII